MKVRLNLWNLIQKELLVIVMHMVILVAFEMLYGLFAYCKTVLFLAPSMLAAYFRMCITHFTFFFIYTDVFALRQVPNPLRFIFADPYVVMLITFFMSL